MKGERIVTEEQLEAYAESDWSDTFASYNDAIVLSREVIRLRKTIKRLKAKNA